MSHSKHAIWCSLASNPHTPLDILKTLLATDDAEVWVRVAHHPAVIADQRRILIDLLIGKIRQDRSTSARLPAWFIYQHAEFPEASLNTLLSSPYWRDRYLVAQHPKASHEVVATLARDGNRFVRVAARTALMNRARLTKRMQAKRER